VIGVSLTSVPRLANASRTALAIAVGGATAPPSPIPFMPKVSTRNGRGHGGCRSPERWFADSPLEGAGFEPSVPP
jgi:hypothetical protein